MIAYFKNYLILTVTVTLYYSCSFKKEDDRNRISGSYINLPPSSVYNLDIDLYDQNGKTIKWESLKGKVSVISMIFTSCRNTCPMLIEALKDIQKKTDKANNIQYILISFDPNDTSSQLLKFSQGKKIDDCWKLLTGHDEDIRSLSMLLDIAYQKIPKGGFSHSSTIIILDPLGNIIGRSNNIVSANEDVIQLLEKTAVKLKTYKK